MKGENVTRCEEWRCYGQSAPCYGHKVPHAMANRRHLGEDGSAAASEDAQMFRVVFADEFEVILEARLVQHREGGQTLGGHTARLKLVLRVEHEHFRAGGNGPLVDDCLPVILRVPVRQALNLEEPEGGREELDAAH